MKKDFFIAVATMVGFIIGAGILSIPYAFSKSGFLTGALVVILLGVVTIIINLMIGETSLRTKHNHQLVGYTGKYLGHKWKKIMLIFITLEWYGALIAYIIKIGEFASALIDPFMHINPIYFSILFGFIGSYLVYKGLLMIEKSEFWMVLLTLIIVSILGIICIPSINLQNLDVFNMAEFLLPFGVVFFAFGGAGAIPEMREELKKDVKLLKPAIITATGIPMIVYILFPLFIVGVTGLSTSEDAMIGLGAVLGYKVLLIGALFGIFNMATSFLAVGLAVKEIFKFDYEKKNIISTLWTCTFPIIAAIVIILLDVDNAFYKVIDINGAIFYPATGIVFIMTYLKARKKGDRKPEYSLKYAKTWSVILVIILLAGLIHKLLTMF